jgi:hypothetical protein
MKPVYVASVVLLAAFAATSSVAQSHGVPASVTSFGFGGNPNVAPGVPASVTSPGPQGFGEGRLGFGNRCCANHFVPFGTPPFIRPNGEANGRHHHNGGNGSGGRFNGYVPIYAYGGYGYYGDYAPMVVSEQESSNSAEGGDSEDGGGPPAYEHRAPRRHPVDEAYDRGYEEGLAAAEEDHAPRADHARKSSESEKRDPKNAKVAAKEEEDRPAPAVEIKTVLVYKDGHKEEVSNYAIVGDQLFDFSNGGHRKIAVADLDVSATTKANDAKGVDFQLPAVRAKK